MSAVAKATGEEGGGGGSCVLGIFAKVRSCSQCG